MIMLHDLWRRVDISTYWRQLKLSQFQIVADFIFQIKLHLNLAWSKI